MDFRKNPISPLRAKRTSSLTILAILCYLCVGCSQSDEGTKGGEGKATGTIIGIVKDVDGNVYPSVLVTISKDGESSDKITDANGKFQLKTNSIGRYEVVLQLPLATKAVSSSSTSLEVKENQESNIDFIIEPQWVKAHLNFGEVQLLEEIVDANGNTPVVSSEPLYAANIFDPPFGMLTAIKAPDGHHVTLGEFKKAKGNLTVHCNGDKAFITVVLEGVIPNGTYTFWLAYLNKIRKVGEPIDFMNDFVNLNNPPIGASNGTENIAVADVDGNINITFEHSSCILTDEVALVIPVLYHINGKTFGGGHVPDPEEMVHMLVYFQ